MSCQIGSRKLAWLWSSSFSQKATKIWKNLPLDLTLLSKNNCFVKTSGIFFQILWPCHNAWTLIVMTYVTGRPQDRLRHDVGAGGRHHGANRTHSNAYEAHPTWSSFQNLRHALGRRIEVGHFFHVFFSSFFFIFSYHLIWSNYLLHDVTLHELLWRFFFLDVCTIFGHIGW